MGRKLKGKNILVTGGAGFIGSNLVDRLWQEEPGRIVVVDNFFLGHEANLQAARDCGKSFVVYRLDAGDVPAMLDIAKKEAIDVLFNLAVVPLPTSLDYPAWTIDSNIRIALAGCELARMGAIETLIHCSSSEAYGSAVYSTMDEAHPLAPTTPYAASKIASDHIVLSYFETFGIDTSIVRPFNNFGPRQNPGSYAGLIPIVIGRVRSGIPVEIYGDGLQTRDYIFVRYTVDAIIRIYECEATRGKVVNVATGREITVNELVTRLLKVMDAETHRVVHTAERPGDVRRHCGDTRLLRELTGYSPNSISDDDLRATANWYAERSR